MSLNQPVGLPYQNPRDYVGPEQNIIPIKRFGRRPTTADRKYRIGQMALLNRDPITGVEGELWYLARFESNGDATWLQLATGSSSPGIDFLQTDDGAPPVGPNGSGVVGVLGGTGIVTSGQDPSTDVTIAVDGSVVGQTITGDSGGPLSPTAGNWNIVGGTGLNTSGAGSTLTINLDGSVITTQYDADSGSATPTAGILNIIGGNGTVTSASGNTVVCEMQSPFVGDFSFESNSGGATETFTIQNTVDAASSAAVADIKIAGTSSAYAQWRVGVDSVGSFGGYIVPAGDEFHLIYANVDNVTPSSATNVPLRIDSINVGTGQSRTLIRSNLTVAAEGTGETYLGLNSGNASGVDVLLQMIQTSATDDIHLHWAAGSGANWHLGTDGSAGSHMYLTNATMNAWPPSSSNTYIQVDNSLAGSISFEQTGALIVPRGTTGERPGTPVNGMIRYNTTTAKFEGYEAGAWANLI